MRNKSITRTVSCSILLFLFLIALINLVRTKDEPTQVRVSKLDSGEYQRFMDLLFSFLDTTGATHNFPLQRIDVRSPGSLKTLSQINSDLSDLGIVQANVRGAADQVRSITYIFKEFVFFLSKYQEKDPYNIQKTIKANSFRVATLDSGSQTYEDVKRFLEFYGYKGKEYELIPGSYEKGLNRLEGDEVHFAFFISGLGNEDFKRVLSNEQSGIHTVTIKHPEALAQSIPGYETDTIPAGFYGKNFKEYPTIATRATLVCSARLNEDLIFYLTQDIFTRRSLFADQFRYLELAKVPETEHVFFPPHPGARRYFEMDRPGLLVRHQGAIGIFLSLIGVLVSLYGTGLMHTLWGRFRSLKSIGSKKSETNPTI